MTLESRKASIIDSEKEHKRIDSGGVDENAAALEKLASDWGMSVEAYLKWMDERENSGKFGRSSDPLNPKHRTQKTSPQSGTVFNTSNWDPGFKFGSMGKEKKKLRGGG